jgi:hypothetical protein
MGDVRELLERRSVKQPTRYVHTHTHTHTHTHWPGRSTQQGTKDSRLRHVLTGKCERETLPHNLFSLV